jgi:predicted RNA-binding Zn ribbon-like protein
MPVSYTPSMDVAALQRQVEQKFAPGPLLAVQGLANTYDFEDDEELLTDPAATREWLLRSGLAADSLEVGAAEHERLREFRAVVRSMLESNLHPDQAAIDTGALDRFAELRVPLAVGPGGELELDMEPAADVDTVIAQMLGAIHAAQLADDWRRLKICNADDCRWAFFDSSKNRGGQWCSMEVCGNRTKNRRYRAARSQG